MVTREEQWRRLLNAGTKNADEERYTDSWSNMHNILKG